MPQSVTSFPTTKLLHANGITERLR